jgi:hypothetical protein
MTVLPNVTAGYDEACCAILTVARGGVAEKEASDVAVNPAGVPSSKFPVITATPAGCRENAARNASCGVTMVTILSMAFCSSLFPNGNMENHGNAVVARRER